MITLGFNISKAKIVSNIKRRLIALTAVFLAGTGCHYTIGPNTEPLDAIRQIAPHEATNLPVHMPDSFIVCRSKQCAPAKLSMSKEYIYNSLVSLFQNNAHKTALICEGSDTTRSCVESYIAMPITVGITPAFAYIDSVKISNVSVNKGKLSINLLLNYNLTYNGQTPDCKPAQTLTFVRNSANIIMEDSGYNCKMTTVSTSNVKTLFAVDYIDLDYGFIGGYYSIGISGPAYGGSNGYMLIRLPKDAYPLAPELKEPKDAQYESVIESTITGNKNATNTELYSGVKVFPITKK